MSAPLTIRCMFPPLKASSVRYALIGERLLTYQAMRLLMRLDAEMRCARADFNDDRFRRIMQARSRAVKRLRRRWEMLNPQPRIALGTLCRRYHANLARYLYEPRQ